jgi:hypothetical protein
MLAIGILETVCDIQAPDLSPVEPLLEWSRKMQIDVV